MQINQNERLLRMIIKELTKEEAIQMLKEHGLSERSLPYRGYAVTLKQDHRKRTFIGHSPDSRYLLQSKTGEPQLQS